MFECISGRSDCYCAKNLLSGRIELKWQETGV